MTHPRKYIDFVPFNKAPNPMERRSERLAQTPVVTKPVTRTVTRSSSYTESRPVQKPVTRPVAKSVPAHPVHRVATTTTTVEEIDYGVIEDYDTNKPATFVKNGEPELKAAGEKKPMPPRYTPGSRMPFITTNVDKRPLSPDVPEHSESGIKSTKNTYSQKRVVKDEEKQDPVTIIEKPKKGSFWKTFLIVVITIILGAAVGGGAYLLLAGR